MRDGYLSRLCGTGDDGFAADGVSELVPFLELFPNDLVVPDTCNAQLVVVVDTKIRTVLKFEVVVEPGWFIELGYGFRGEF